MIKAPIIRHTGLAAGHPPLDFRDRPQTVRPMESVVPNAPSSYPGPARRQTVSGNPLPETKAVDRCPCLGSCASFLPENAVKPCTLYTIIRGNTPILSVICIYEETLIKSNYSTDYTAALDGKLSQPHRELSGLQLLAQNGT